jgi:methyl-accepting chemotaxis protein
MSIRVKLYTAIAVAVAGLALTAGVGIWSLTRVSDRFDAVQTAADSRALALQLKFDVTDFNGWQTAYGYDAGKSRPLYLAAIARYHATVARARTELRRPEEQVALRRLEAAVADFERLDVRSWAALQAGRADEVKRLLLGPEIANFQRAAAAAERLAAAEDAFAQREERRFRRARHDALRFLVAAAVVAALLVAILLVTALDLARLAEQRLAAGDGDAPPGEAGEGIV